MKYIDADLLRKDIDNWKEAMADAVGEYSDGVRFALEHYTFVLDSLQQEQPEVDLDEEINRFWDACIKHKNERGGNVIWSNKIEVEVLARHFYELGLKSK